MAQIISVQTHDVRFPTSLDLDGSDAVNVAPDYSAAYVQIDTDSSESGHGLVFTCGRGNEIVTAAIESLGGLLLGADVEELLDDLGEAARRLVHDSQLRWLGPEKGVSHMAAGALINALWDLAARRAGKPLWRYVAEMEPEEVVRAIDFTHITDALTPDEALEILRRGQEGKSERIAQLEAEGFPAYTTSPGWLGYSDEKLIRLSKQAVADGFELIKLKVGGSLADDRRRLKLVRRELGEEFRVAIDANQGWDVDEAIEWVNALAEFDPWWIEEATSTDDILGHARIREQVAPVKVATGEAVANRIVVKQLLQAGAIDVLQIDATRVAGLNENLANMLLAAKFGVPVCPHAGGVGLCELAQHFSFIDYAVIATSQQDRYIEYVDHLHEHFVAPARVQGGRYLPPQMPGTNAEMHIASRQRWSFPHGVNWLEITGGVDGTINRLSPARMSESPQ